MKPLLLLSLLILPLTCCDERGSGGGDASSLHIHVAPHGGTLVELGDHLGNVEFVLQSSAGMLTAYFLDAHAEQPVRLQQPTLTLQIEGQGVTPAITLTLQAVASSLTGETVGDTSQFQASHDALAARTHLQGVIEKVEYRGRTFTQVPFIISQN
jgi:hypothetical protein